jgi:hypothetical protein
MKLRLRLNKIKIKGTREKSTMCDISRKCIRTSKVKLEFRQNYRWIG